MIEGLRVRIPAGAAGEFSSPGSTLCIDSYFGIRSTPVACKTKRSQLFCRWQVTAETRMHLIMHTCGFALSDMAHGCMVYTERTETAVVSCGISHASAVSVSTLWWILKKRVIKTIYSCRITCEHSESAPERRISLYKQSPIKSEEVSK